MAAEEGNRAEALLQSNSRDAAKIFDFRAVSILEEAVSLGALPQFSLHSSAPLDLRGIPPSTAEVRMLPASCSRAVLLQGLPLLKVPTALDFDGGWEGGQHLLSCCMVA